MQLEKSHTCNQEIDGSTSGQVPLHSKFGQVVRTSCVLCASYTTHNLVLA